MPDETVEGTPTREEAIGELSNRVNELAGSLEAHGEHLEANVVRNAGLKPFVSQLRGIGNELETIAGIDEALEAEVAAEDAVNAAPPAPASSDKRTRVLSNPNEA